MSKKTEETRKERPGKDRALPRQTAPFIEIEGDAGNDSRDDADTDAGTNAGAGAGADAVGRVDPVEYADDRFAVTDEIARGGMGRVLAARDRRLERTVAIKEALGDSEEVLRRFEREVRITARLQHPAILPLYDARAWPSGAPYYVMRLVSGEPLLDRISRSTSLDSRLELLPRLLAAADAIAFAHDASIIHRDIKPSNILVGEHGDTVVIDWGIAKLLDEDDEGDEDDEDDDDDVVDDDTEQKTGASVDATRPGAVLGTPGYMAPEQVVADKATKQSDVYALGATLYHVLSGKRPFEGITSEKIAARQLDGPPPPLRDVAPGVPRELVAITTRALATDPSDRYADASEFAEDLRRFQSGRLVSAHEYTTAQRLVRFARRHRAVLAVGTIAAVVIALIVGGSLRRIAAERDTAIQATARAVASAEREADRADELLLVRAKRLLEAGEATGAVALLKKLPTTTRRTREASIIFHDARRTGIRTELPGPKSWANVAWHPSKPLLLVAGDNQVKVADVSTFSPSLKTLATFPTFVRFAEFVDDGRHIVVAAGNVIALVATDGTSRKDVVTTQTPIIALVAPTDGSFIVWREKSGRLARRESATGALQELATLSGGTDTEISADGRTILVQDAGAVQVLRDGKQFKLDHDAWYVRLDGPDRALGFAREAMIEYDLREPPGRETRRWKVDAPTRAARTKTGNLIVTDRLRETHVLEATGKHRLTGEGVIHQTEVGVVLRTPERLELLEQAYAVIGVSGPVDSISQLTAGHGLIAVGQRLQSRILIFRLDDLVRDTVQLDSASGVSFAGDKLLISRRSDVLTYDRQNKSVDKIGSFSVTITYLVASDGFAINHHGPFSEAMRLSDGKIEKVPLSHERLALRGDMLTYIKGNTVRRRRLFADSDELVYDAGEPVSDLFYADGRLIVRTTGGANIVGAGDADEWRHERGSAAAPATYYAGSLYVGNESEVLRIDKSGATTHARLSEPARFLLARPAGVLATTATTASLIASSGPMQTIPLGPIHTFRLLADESLVVFRSGAGEALLADFSRLETRRLSERTTIKSIETNNKTEIAILHANGRLEIQTVAEPLAAERLFPELDRSTPATIDARTDELIWP